MQQKPKWLNLLMALTLAMVAAPATAALAQADTQGPNTAGVATTPTSPSIGEEVTVTATINDVPTGGSNIASAEYKVNGEAWVGMTASDGAFDSPTEDVTATFTAGGLGLSDLCVRGTDSAGNLGEESCLKLEVKSLYNFAGFLPPVGRGTNYVRAGRTVPLKWILTTADGKAVSDLNVLEGIRSYQVDCTSLVGDAAALVQEKGPGDADVRATLAGDWRALWKTPKSYAGTCRMVFVAFDDGSTSPPVLFRFR